MRLFRIFLPIAVITPSVIVFYFGTHSVPLSLLLFLVLSITAYGILSRHYLPNMSEREEVLVIFLLCFSISGAILLWGIAESKMLDAVVLILLTMLALVYGIKDLSIRSKFKHLVKLIEKGDKERLAKEVLKIFEKNGYLIQNPEKIAYERDEDLIIFSVTADDWKYTMIITKDDRVSIMSLT